MLAVAWNGYESEGRGAIAMPLESEIVPAIARATKDLETRLNISLPDDLQELWQKCNGLRLFEDKTYGQSGLIIWSPQKVAEKQKNFAAKI